MLMAPPPKSVPVGAGVVPALLEVVAPNMLPPGAVAVVVDPNKGVDALGLVAFPENKFAVPDEAGVAPKEKPPGVVAPAPPAFPNRLPAGCLLSVVPLLVVWPKMLGVGAPDDAGVLLCPKRLPPPPEVPKLKDILGGICSLSSSRMAIHQELVLK